MSDLRSRSRLVGNYGGILSLVISVNAEGGVFIGAKLNCFASEAPASSGHLFSVHMLEKNNLREVRRGLNLINLIIPGYLLGELGAIEIRKTLKQILGDHQSRVWSVASTIKKRESRDTFNQFANRFFESLRKSDNSHSMPYDHISSKYDEIIKCEVVIDIFNQEGDIENIKVALSSKIITQWINSYIDENDIVNPTVQAKPEPPWFDKAFRSSSSP